VIGTGEVHAFSGKTLTPKISFLAIDLSKAIYWCIFFRFFFEVASAKSALEI
jgi:hypothetical protein